MAILAVDVGGTKLAVAVVETGDRTRGTIRRRRTAVTDRSDPWPGLARLVEEVLVGATPADAPADAGADAPADAGAGATVDEVPVAVGVGCGGPMAPGGSLVSPLNIPGWRDFPLIARLSALTGLPVAVDNDAKALALGEGWCGAAHGTADYLAMVVSTGIGGGIVLGGRLLEGAGGNAGHIGHVVVEPGGRRCGCGGRGCLEAETSGLAIEATTGRPPAEAPPEVRVRAGRLVGQAVAGVCCLLDLRLAVVAGSVALGYGDIFFDAAQRELDARCRISFARGARIVPAGLGADGPLVGAAAVALAAFGDALSPSAPPVAG